MNSERQSSKASSTPCRGPLCLLRNWKHRRRREHFLSRTTANRNQSWRSCSCHCWPDPTKFCHHLQCIFVNINDANYHDHNLDLDWWRHPNLEGWVWLARLPRLPGTCCRRLSGCSSRTACSSARRPGHIPEEGCRLVIGLVTQAY